MISLEQIKQLQSRVHAVVARIRTLSAENATLKESLSSYEGRIDELEKLVSAFKSEQQEIEAGIIAALSQLDGLEDAVAEPPAERPPEPNGSSPDPTGRGPVSDLGSDDDGADQNSADEDSTAGNTPNEENPAESGAREDLPDSEPDEEEPELDIF